MHIYSGKLYKRCHGPRDFEWVDYIAFVTWTIDGAGKAEGVNINKVNVYMNSDEAENTNQQNVYISDTIELTYQCMKVHSGANSRYNTHTHTQNK